MNAFTRTRRAGRRAIPKMKNVSESTISRLSLYLRLLEELARDGMETVSSDTLAKRAGTTAAQVRKDLSVFGTFGKRGLGYRVADLIGELRTILGLSRRWKVALVGAGKIGAALYGYEGFRRRGFDIEAVFDADPSKVGQRWNGVEVLPADRMEEEVSEGGYEIVIVAVPASAAQDVVDRLVDAGVRAILNFAPTKLHVPEGVKLKNVNMAVEMESLSYALTNDGAGGRRMSTKKATTSASGSSTSSSASKDDG
ncbi:MAG: redox-sensing transcriptional repressor Rex [Gemmatimonadota bacterium]